MAKRDLTCETYFDVIKPGQANHRHARRLANILVFQILTQKHLFIFRSSSPNKWIILNDLKEEEWSWDYVEQLMDGENTPYVLSFEKIS